jgi:hypothetical protein
MFIPASFSPGSCLPSNVVVGGGRGLYCRVSLVSSPFVVTMHFKKKEELWQVEKQDSPKRLSVHTKGIYGNI